MGGYAPRAPVNSVRPRRSSGRIVRPLNFTVRRLMLRIATCAAVPYDARPEPSGFDTEVSHATQTRTPRRRVLSRSPVSEGRGSRQRLKSNGELASSAATRASVRSSAAMTHAPATQAADFKNCCMLSGELDGSDRHHFFQGVSASSNNRWSGPFRSEVGVAGAWKNYAPATPIWRFWAAAQLHR